MELYLISPLQKQTFSVAWLEINTPAGNFVIQRDHVPMILILSADQPITFRLKNGKQDSLMIRQGIIEITRISATILMNETF
jgi:F0F1-type ATP synthase epsilon subunit